MSKVWMLIDEQGYVMDAALFEDAPAPDWHISEGWMWAESADGHWRVGYKYDSASKRTYDPNPPPESQYPTKDEMETPDVIT